MTALELVHFAGASEIFGRSSRPGNPRLKLAEVRPFEPHLTPAERDEIDAYAQLFAASPAMLEALQVVVASHDGRVFPSKCACGECEPARAAIAKAVTP